eukprot:TRINITY_DN580_c0_g2_i1.p1 TRINITY_DN580_c0_g2~~TRINITY_DN580_c0_g2_i1.p1  ORF type:complete len:147 (+),score=46.44 TRINITY_DN580_c0_g2_i1:91-531(+)
MCIRDRVSTQSTGVSPDSNMAAELTPEEKESLKAIKIKTGVCRRMRKEYTFYVKDNVALKANVDKMKEENACPHDIKKQEEVLEEGEMMLTPTLAKLQTQYEELWGQCAEVEEEESAITATEEYGITKTLLAEIGQMEEISSMDEE